MKSVRSDWSIHLNTGYADKKITAIIIGFQTFPMNIGKFGRKGLNMCQFSYALMQKNKTV